MPTLVASSSRERYLPIMDERRWKNFLIQTMLRILRAAQAETVEMGEYHEPFIYDKPSSDTLLEEVKSDAFFDI